MSLIPIKFSQIIGQEIPHHKAILDIEDKLTNIIKNQTPIFFPHYTDHGIEHFANTLKMALHLVDIDEFERQKSLKSAVDYLNSLNVLVLTASILFHDLGMHVHFKGFKQLINGFFDDVRVDFFDDLTWKQEWENFMIEAKRFSGRERLNLFGDEQAIVKEIDFSKQTVDSDIDKILIGEFIRRHHGRLAHEIAIKGFPSQESEVILFAQDLKVEYRNIIGLIARSHNMQVRDAMEYIQDEFPADPHFPYDIECPFLMCVLRVSDYFQFDSSRTNTFRIKLESILSPFSLNEHKAHLATEYFKVDEKDPETLFVDLKPIDGLMYSKLVILFNDIQREVDTSFAIIGEMYGRKNSSIKLRYRRIKTNLKNKKVVDRFPFVAGSYRFEADSDLFKLLVGPLYGYDASYGVRELIQNAVDACIELEYKMDALYIPSVEVEIRSIDSGFVFMIKDNGKGMSIGEIKNYFLKAGASFRNSTEWKIDYQTEENTPAIRRTGKFGIGVLASFLIGDSIEVTTKRYNQKIGYTFVADLKNDFIEIRKTQNCETGTTIVIKMSKDTYNSFHKDMQKLTQWYVLSHPKVSYTIDSKEVENDKIEKINLIHGMQEAKDSVKIKLDKFDDIIWSYNNKKAKTSDNYLAINGIIIPSKYDRQEPKNYNLNEKDRELAYKKNIYNRLVAFPFVSVLDRNNIIDLELNRNSIRGELPFINELIESCELDFLYKLIFSEKYIENNMFNYKKHNNESIYRETSISLDARQFVDEIYATTSGYFIDNSFYNPIAKNIDFYKVYVDHNEYIKKDYLVITDNSVCGCMVFYGGVNAERDILRQDYRSYYAISRSRIYVENYNSDKIAKSVREKLSLVKNNGKYAMFSNGGFVMRNQDNIINLFENNNAVAVVAQNKTLNDNSMLSDLLRRHFKKPELIPYDIEEKKKYVKTLSPELINHIVDKRGIVL